jgi:hypothetical protein
VIGKCTNCRLYRHVAGFPMSVGESAIMRALTSRSQMRGLQCLTEVKFEASSAESRYEFFAARSELSGYSYLSATMGSTRVARLDGT